MPLALGARACIGRRPFTGYVTHVSHSVVAQLIAAVTTGGLTVCTDSSPIKVFRSAYARQCESAWRAENRLDPRLQLRRRRGRLCQNTCHGFPPAIRTRTVAWRHGASLPATGAASLDPRTNERRPSHQQASRIAPTSVPLAPASVDLAPPTARTAAFRLCAPARQRESVWRSGKPP